MSILDNDLAVILAALAAVGVTVFTAFGLIPWVVA